MNFKRKRGNGEKLDFELNIVPIIDCFTILITFMLAAGVYISIAALDVGVSGAKAQAQEIKKEGVELKIEMSKNMDLRLEMSGTHNRSIQFHAVSGKWNFEKLAKELAVAQGQFREVKSLTLVAHPDIAYQDVIKAMEVSKKTHPDVLLGGF